jgi:hypothetical protein
METKYKMVVFTENALTILNYVGPIDKIHSRQ